MLLISLVRTQITGRGDDLSLKQAINTFRNESNHVDVPRVVSHRRQSRELHQPSVFVRAAIVIARVDIVIAHVSIAIGSFMDLNERFRDTS